MTGKKSFLFLLLTGIILRLCFTYLLPPFTGNDEPAHLRYAQHILVEKKLPNANLYSNENLAGNEYFQPPLYYIILAPVLAITTSINQQLEIARLISILFWLFAFYFSYRILLIINVPTWLATSTLALISLLPTYVVNTSTVTNDALIVPLVIVTLYFLLSNSKNLTTKNILMLGLLTSVSILIKLTGFILIPTVLLAFLHSKKKWGFNSILYFLSIFVLTSWWFAYNYTTYENPIGPLKASVANLSQIPFNPHKIFLILRGVFATFWVAYGSFNEIRLHVYIYLLLFALTIAASIGVLKFILNNKLSFNVKGFPLLILSCLLLANITLLFTFNTIQLQPLGRYLFPSLIPISLGFSIGLHLVIPKILRKLLPITIILLLLFLNILGINSIINYY